MAATLKTQQYDPPALPSRVADPQASVPRHAWTTDRWGRLLAGASISLCLAGAWLLGGETSTAGIVLLLLASLIACELVLTSLIGWCPLHQALRGCGVPDREEVFADRWCGYRGVLPAGQRPRVLESNTVHVATEAAEYDAMIHRHAWLLNRPFVKLLARLGLARARVLDIGTGPGWIPIELAQRQPGWEIWALDASEDMLARACGHAAAAGVSERIHWVPGNAVDLPFPDGHFDLVISHFTLHHLEHPHELFREAARVTRAGGRVIVKDLLRQPCWKAALLLAFSKYVLGYSPLQLQMYRESIDAALTFDELRLALERSPLAGAQVRGFRGLDFIVGAEVGELLPCERVNRQLDMPQTA